VAPDLAPGDHADLIGVDEPQAVLGGDHDPVEEVEVGHLKHMLEGADLGAGTAQHRCAEHRRLVGNRRLVGHWFPVPPR